MIYTLEKVPHLWVFQSLRPDLSCYDVIMQLAQTGGCNNERETRGEHDWGVKVFNATSRELSLYLFGIHERTIHELAIQKVHCYTYSHLHQRSMPLYIQKENP